MKNPRVVFIEPKSPDCHIFSLYPLPRLGPIVMGTMLERAGFQVEVILEEKSPVGLQDLQGADVVALTATTSTAPRAYAYARVARNLGKPTVIGGPHVTYCLEEALRHCHCAVAGEGEGIVVDLFRRLAAGDPVDDLPGVATPGRLDPGRPPVPDLDELPIPDLNLVRGLDLGRRVLRARVAPVQASRGCPHRCAFCSVTGMFGRQFRFRSVDHVMEELSLHHRHGRRVFFYDDNLAARPEWFETLLERMASQLPGLQWSAQVRVEVARDQRVVALMRRAGCATVFVGLESLSPETLRLMNKHQSCEDIEGAVATFGAHGIAVHGMFVLGMDTDSPLSVRRTLAWAKRSRLSSAQFLVLTPFPGTAVFEELQAQGRILFREWALYDGHHVVFRPAQMSPLELQRLQVEAHTSFYSWRRTLARALTCRLEAAAVYTYARSLQRTWLRHNRVFSDLLSLMHRADGMIGGVELHHPASLVSF